MAARRRDDRAGLREALRLVRSKKVERRAPDERDIPPPGRFPGPKEKALPGQIDLYGNEVEK